MHSWGGAPDFIQRSGSRHGVLPTALAWMAEHSRAVERIPGSLFSDHQPRRLVPVSFSYPFH